MSARGIDTVEELLSLCTLAQVTFDRYGFERIEHDFAGVENEQRDVDIGFQTRQADDPPRLDVRGSAEVVSADAKLQVTVTALFDVSEPIEPLNGALEKGFIEGHAAVMLMNFLREGMIALATRARVPAPLLPLVGVGAFQAFEVAANEPTDPTTEGTHEK